MLLAGEKVPVTGASAGIGGVAAIGAARRGADVEINYTSEEAGTAARVNEMEAPGRRALSVQGDVADPATATDFVARAVETLERTFRVDLHGACSMVQAAANAMVTQGTGGAIVSVPSISARVGGDFQPPYAPTKAGVPSLMQSAAIVLGDHAVRCKSVLPGTILTDTDRDDPADEEKRAGIAAHVPLGRSGEPADLAGPIFFLASDVAGLLVDAGAFVSLQ